MVINFLKIVDNAVELFIYSFFFKKRHEMNPK
jgi:hypothetical protein